jgi:hypothetical protein
MAQDFKSYNTTGFARRSLRCLHHTYFPIGSIQYALVGPTRLFANNVYSPLVYGFLPVCAYHKSNSSRLIEVLRQRWRYRTLHHLAGTSSIPPLELRQVISEFHYPFCPFS